MIKVSADFETTSTQNYLRDGEVRVWSYNIRRIDNKQVINEGTTFEEFMEFISKQSYEMYFHNLRFDGMFILHNLFKMGFNWTKKATEAGEFSTLITDTNVWYSIVIIHKKFNKRYVKTKILDSFKKLPFSLNQIAKGFKLETQKGSIDYEKYRSKDYVMTEEEHKYQNEDTLIVAQALDRQFSEGLTKMTIGGDALNDFKNRVGKKGFKYLFPVLPHSVDKDIRESYKGGYVYVNPKYKNVLLDNIISYDVNSLFPSEMRHKMLPYGFPVYFEGKYKNDTKHPLHISVIRCNFELKEGYIPTIQLKNSFRFNPTEYLTTSNDSMVQMTLTSVDLELLLEHYNIKEIEYICGWKFKGVVGIFNDYIDYWGHIKETSTGALRQLAKLMLNNLYGKFGTNGEKCQVIPFYNKEKEVVQFQKGEVEIEDPVYTALACFVTAHARHTTITSAQKIGIDNFVYADTDSLKIINLKQRQVKKLLKIDDVKMGYWKFEGYSSKGRFLRAKTYILQHETYHPNRQTKTVVTCAGMPDKVKEGVNFDNFTYGSVFKGKLLQTKVKGGVLLKETEFTIKE